MEDDTTTRRRAKTPVFAIGQLERNSMVQYPPDWAQTLADEYQAELPSRTVTPCISRLSTPCVQHKPSILRSEDMSKMAPNRLRKIKCQSSLRELVKQHSVSPPLTPFSDDETLLGSESPRSSYHSISPSREKFHLPVIDQVKKASSVESFSNVPSLLQYDSDIGLKICVELLTNELSNTLLCPQTQGDRTSGLEILLMIEAYETVQQHVRQKASDLYARGLNPDHVATLEEILDHWLQVLYGIYDCSEMKKEEEEMHDDCWKRERPETPESGYASANEEWDDCDDDDDED